MTDIIETIVEWIPLGILVFIGLFSYWVFDLATNSWVKWRE